MLSYNVSKAPELKASLDPIAGTTDSTCFVLNEIYESEAGIADHFAQVQSSWTDCSAFVEWMGKDVYDFSPKKGGYCTVVYKKYLGPTLAVPVGKISHVRCCSAVYFPRYRLVFASIWLDHNWYHNHDQLLVFKNLSQALSAEFLSMQRPIERVILTMDSNDYRGSDSQCAT